MQINKEDFLAILTAVKPGLANKEIIEHTTHFIFTPSFVQTYNDQISIQHPFDGDIQGAIKAEEFYALINKMPSGDLDIEQKEGEIRIKIGKTKAKIKIIEEHQVPIDGFAKIGAWHPLPDDFTEAIKFALFSVGKDLSRQDLTNLKVMKSLVLSSDRFRITKKEMAKPIKTSFLLPGFAAETLIHYSPTKYQQTKDGWLHFTNAEKVMFICRTMPDIDYPNLDPLFADIQGPRIKFPATLEESIARCEVIAKAEILQDTFVTITMGKNKLFCKGQGAIGEVEDEHRLMYKGEEITFQINPQFLKEILPKLQTVTVGDKALLFSGPDFKHAIRRKG